MVLFFKYCWYLAFILAELGFFSINASILVSNLSKVTVTATISLLFLKNNGVYSLCIAYLNDILVELASLWVSKIIFQELMCLTQSLVRGSHRSVNANNSLHRI